MKGGKIMKDYKFNGSISLEVLGEISKDGGGEQGV